jgi:RNA polymerase sigma-70 factor, ECF subfamily
MSDEELACRAQRGCAESLDELLRRFQSPVLHFLRHRGPAAEAEDLLQETFLCVYQNLHRYRRRWRFATWVFTIARRQSINRYRRWRPPTSNDDVALSAAPGPETAEIVAAADHRRRLWAVAAEILSEEELTALWLHYVEEMPTRDIATVVGRSRVAVKTMLFRARRRLLPHLEKLDGRWPDRADAAAFGRPDVRPVPLEVHDV